MKHSSQVSLFILGAYFDTGPLRWLYFFIIMSVYALIVLSNLLLFVVICLNRTLHEPMYIFLCSLFIYEIYGSTAVLPFVSILVVQDVHTVTYSLCFLQIFCIHTCGSVNFTNLTLMSYDRYVAICFPLQYHSLMNNNKVVVLIFFIWMYSIVAVGITIILSVSLTLCGNLIDSVYCDNYFIVKQACSDTSVTKVYQVVSTILFVMIPLSIIFFTYIQILKVCFNGSKQTRQKAVSTCTPHLCSLLNFPLGPAFSILQTRLNVNNWPQMLRIILTVYHVICKPLVNTLVYGLNLSKIRKECKGLLFKFKNKITMQ